MRIYIRTYMTKRQRVMVRARVKEIIMDMCKNRARKMCKTEKLRSETQWFFSKNFKNSQYV